MAKRKPKTSDHPRQAGADRRRLRSAEAPVGTLVPVPEPDEDPGEPEGGDDE